MKKHTSPKRPGSGKNSPSEDRTYRIIRRKILTIILFAACVPLVLVSAVILYQFYEAYKSKVEEHLAALVQKQTQNIDTFLQERLADIQVLSRQNSLQELQNKAMLEQELESLQSVHGNLFVDVGLVAESGHQIVYAGPYELEEADYSQAQWFHKALDNKTTISDVFLGKRGYPHFIVTARFLENGQPWVLRSTIDFGAFTNLVQNMRIGQTGFAFIMNKEGELQTQAPKETRFDAHIYLQLAQSTQDDALVTSARIRDQGQCLLSIAPLKNGQWMFVYQQQSSEIFADLNKALILAMGIVLIGILGIASTGVILSSHMISRIQTINAEKEVMNQQVLQAGKMAAVGELAAGIAHEINNPVAIMVEEAGWVEDLLEDEKLSNAENEQEIQRALHEIAIQGKRSKDITHKLLSFARKTDSRVQEVDLAELIEEILGVSNQRAKFASVTVHTEIQPDLPLVQASPTEMQQVVLNLVNNALDAMENMQGGELTIRAALQEQWIVVEVEDTGPGIAKHDQDRIFEPFFTTKAVGKGTGLGLSICYGIVEKMGGHIRVKSRIGAGSTFILELPVSENIGGKNATG